MNQSLMKEKEALQEDHQRAVVLELLGDLPSAEIKAPDHVLFVCKLNPVTTAEDLEIIFSRFGPILRYVGLSSVCFNNHHLNCLNAISH